MIPLAYVRCADGGYLRIGTAKYRFLIGQIHGRVCVGWPGTRYFWKCISGW